MYNQFKETAKHPTLMASILGLINPVTIIPILTVGIIGTLIYKASKKSKNENQRLKTVNEAVNSTVKNMSDEELKKEMIRQTMSELGKRSAEARQLKK